jgi:general secretion pathway protein D
MSVIVHALDQRGGSDLLSAPRITTKSGVSANIEVVEEIIYPTEFEAQSADTIAGGTTVVQSDQAGQPIPGTAQNNIVIFPESFETREVGVILNVTPTVGPDNYTIDLTLTPEVAELVDWIQYGTPPFNIPQPVFASRNATTSIVIWDGQTVVMGGLINEEIVRFEDKIPFLGDIPIVGRLFRSEGERSVKRNLLIFVTARIVDPGGRNVNRPDARAVPDATIAFETD